MNVLLELPWPPSANNSKYPRKDGKGMASTKELKAFHTLSVLEIRSMKLKPMTPPYEVTIWFHAPKTVSRYDIANYEKAVTDSLVKAGLITDDCKIDVMNLRRMAKSGGGFVVVRIREIPCNPTEGMVQGG